MKLQFTKMHGIGNDFMVVDAINQSVHLTPHQIQSLANRHFGIGFDQLLLVESSQLADFKYRIFNADGNEVSQCGNGARCFARFVYDQKLTTKNEISVETASGIIKPKLEKHDLVTVNMGTPQFTPADIPFIADTANTSYTLDLDCQPITIAALSMGNPHAVQIVEDVDTAPVESIGRKIELHPRFPERVNAGFMQIIDPHHIKLRVFERGSGETLACGTGACAAVVAGIRWGLLSSPVLVTARGGELQITWQGDNADVMMTGPAITVFSGSVTLPLAKQPYTEERNLRIFMQQVSTEQNNAITADQVSEFLRSHTHFFEQHASLLTEIYLPSPHGNGTISLAERQQLAQRDKIRTLEAILAQMVESGKHNDLTQSKVYRLSVQLLANQNFDTLQSLIAQSLQQDFGVTQSLLRLWIQPNDNSLTQEAAFATVEKEFIDWIISLSQPFCGAKPDVAKDLLASRLGSFAFIPLTLSAHSLQASGVLILASEEEHRFNAEMGTIYLTLIGELISAALARHI